MTSRVDRILEVYSEDYLSEELDEPVLLNADRCIDPSQLRREERNLPIPPRMWFTEGSVTNPVPRQVIPDSDSKERAQLAILAINASIPGRVLTVDNTTFSALVSWSYPTKDYRTERKTALSKGWLSWNDRTFKREKKTKCTGQVKKSSVAVGKTTADCSPETISSGRAVGKTEGADPHPTPVKPVRRSKKTNGALGTKRSNG